MGDTGHGHTVLRFGIVDRMPTGDGALRLGGDVEASAKNLGEQLHRQLLARPADEVDRRDRRPAHRVDVGQGIRRRYPPPVVGIVDDRGEEVSGREHREVIADPDGRGIVTVVEADEDIGTGLAGQALDRLFELAGRDLAGTPSAVGE